MRADVVRRSIDLNCDMGERPDAGGAAGDAALMAVVTSVNIACGGHAGDEGTMRACVRAAVLAGVAIGAHPGYPDRTNFGRVERAMPLRELEDEVARQIAALDGIARSEGGLVRHVKPHGALYHAAMGRAEFAEAVGRAVSRAAPGAVLVGLSGSAGMEAWAAMGLRVVSEAFADRMYESDGSLRARGEAGAVITDAGEAARQAVRLAARAGTICVHSDTEGALEIARAVRAALEAAGVIVRSLTAHES